MVYDTAGHGNIEEYTDNRTGDFSYRYYDDSHRRWWLFSVHDGYLETYMFGKDEDENSYWMNNARNEIMKELGLPVLFVTGEDGIVHVLNRHFAIKKSARVQLKIATKTEGNALGKPGEFLNVRDEIIVCKSKTKEYYALKKRNTLYKTEW